MYIYNLIEFFYTFDISDIWYLIFDIPEIVLWKAILIYAIVIDGVFKIDIALFTFNNRFYLICGSSIMHECIIDLYILFYYDSTIIYLLEYRLYWH